MLCGLSCEHSDRGDQCPCSCGSNGLFSTFGEPPAPSQLGECPFNHPAARQDLKALRRIGPPNDFDRPFSHGGECGSQFVASIAAVSENVAQPGKAPAYCRQNINSLTTLLDVGGMNKEEDQEATGIRHDMALAALDLLPRVIAREPVAFRGFYRLAVNHARARKGFTPLDLAQPHD